MSGMVVLVAVPAPGRVYPVCKYVLLRGSLASYSLHAVGVNT